MDEFHIGDEVEFTDKCSLGWYFGPTKIYKTGKIIGRSDIETWDWDVLISGMTGIVREEHIRHPCHIIPYSELQTGDTEEDI